MARTHEPRDDSNLQSALLDDPEFLREIVETAVQRLLNGQFEAALGAGR